MDVILLKLNIGIPEIIKISLNSYTSETKAD